MRIANGGISHRIWTYIKDHDGATKADVFEGIMEDGDKYSAFNHAIYLLEKKGIVDAEATAELVKGKGCVKAVVVKRYHAKRCTVSPWDGEASKRKEKRRKESTVKDTMRYAWLGYDSPGPRAFRAYTKMMEGEKTARPANEDPRLVEKGLDERGLNGNGLKPCKCGYTWCAVRGVVGKRGLYAVECPKCKRRIEADIKKIRNTWNNL